MTRLHPRIALSFAVALALSLAATAFAAALFATEFKATPGQSSADFAKYGWTPSGGDATKWRIIEYTDAPAKDAGAFAEFVAKAQPETLTNTFKPVKDPRGLKLSFRGGWVWGDEGQGADNLGVQILDAEGNGYQFTFHRINADWAAQHALVTTYKPGQSKWDGKVRDGRQPSVKTGGQLRPYTIERDDKGTWTFYAATYKDSPATFTDTTTTTFTQVRLLGPNNFDVPAYNYIALDIRR